MISIVSSEKSCDLRDSLKPDKPSSEGGLCVVSLERKQDKAAVPSGVTALEYRPTVVLSNWEPPQLPRLNLLKFSELSSSEH